MSDGKLRELERRWKESGSPDDEAAYVHELVRVGAFQGWEGYQRYSNSNANAVAAYLTAQVEAGALGREKLTLAACFGDAASQTASGEPAPCSPRDAIERAASLRSSCGDQACVRAVVAAARYLIPEDFPDKESFANRWALARVLPAIHAAEDWIQKDDDRTIRQAQRRGLNARDAHAGTLEESAAHVAAHAALSAANDHIDRCGHALRGIHEASTVVGNDQLERVLHDELVPWLLGYSDPVKDRVEARRLEAAERE